MRAREYADIDGREIHNPIPYHGNKTEIPARMLRNIIHVFQLPPDIFD